MFGFLKKKKKKTAAIITIAVELLQIQISMGDAEDNHSFKVRLTDKYSRGYIVGFCDAIFQSAGIQDDAEETALLEVIHTALFGEGTGAKIVEQSYQDKEKETFTKGLMKGGQDLVEYSRNGTPRMSLTRYLLNGEIQ